MKLRVAIWAGVGALVVVLWTLYISATHHSALGIVQTVVYLTCPIALAGHLRLSFYFVLLVNAATYALVGMLVETTWRQYRANRLISN
jgi:hypothetical protein